LDHTTDLVVIAKLKALIILVANFGEVEGLKRECNIDLPLDPRSVLAGYPFY